MIAGLAHAGQMTESHVHLTDDDVRAARRAWLTAHEEDPDSGRTARLYDGYRRVVSAQAQQIADDFRRRRAER
ncbi:hypothetical protein EDF34_2903 [Cellulomonas sp. PhB150]|nr:hypothetical protein EDF34_2903 [Cellulomonas sp. PhB150]